jgi:site-specific DNA-cytosine methylase
VDNDEEEEEATVVLDSKPASAKSKSRVKKKPSDGQDGKGIDFNLPPIDNIDDAFVDMAAKAVELGLVNALNKLNGRRINVATMCSGTESPLLAFELLSKALKKAGQPSLNVHQKFAAEIEVFKQAFIERNQSPEIIFRDVREFIPDDAATAITAYGAEAEIPSGLDVLIAGFVCKDLSRLNSQPKGLDDNGESGDTWRAIYSYAKHFRPSIVLLENVKGLSKLWNDVVSKWDNIGYEAAWLIRDTKRYHIPQTRERMYMIAIERSHYGKNANEAVIHWQDLMEKLQGQCSSPYEAWLKNMLNESSDHSALISEVDWALCKLRYDHIRSEERLGILRPVTKWSENGTVRYVSNN